MNFGLLQIKGGEGVTDKELIEMIEERIKDMDKLLRDSVIMGTPLESAKALAVLVEARATVKMAFD